MSDDPSRPVPCPCRVRRVLVALLVAGGLAGRAPDLAAQDAPDAAPLAPRASYVLAPLRVPTTSAGATGVLADGDLQDVDALRLTIKLVDAARGRALADGTLVSRAGADLAPLRALAADEGLTFRPLVALPEDALAALEARAARRSRRAQPDLAGMLAVDVPHADAARLVAIGNRLSALDVVEYAQLERLGAPPPGDIAPATPDLTSHQAGYLGAMSGMNVSAAWAAGLTGAGVALRDCEYGWNAAHEDLVDVDLHLEPGQTIAPAVFANGWAQHGTAVLGETSAPSNAYGVTGMAHGAEVHTYPEWSVEEGPRRVTAIARALADSAEGDVVLLEMQSSAIGGVYGPAELDANVHALVSVGTAAGVVVVGAAGNGAADLDAAAYATYQAWGDSGAILVGAGSASAAHSKLPFSTYGSRVSLQGWGENVFTLGYGAFAQYGGDPDQAYTSGFNGTSSASPFVASACVLLEELALALHGQALDPYVLRQLLIDTGTPQGAGGHIGPLPDLAAAMTAVSAGSFDPWTPLAVGGLAGVAGVPTQTPDGSLLPGSPFRFDLAHAKGLSFAWHVIGVAQLMLPFKGGTMVPSVDLVLGPFVVLPAGTTSYAATWPGGIPAATDVFFQFWVKDAAGPAGFSATAGVQGTTP